MAKSKKPSLRKMLKEVKQTRKLTKDDTRFTKYFFNTMKDIEELLTEIVKEEKK